MRGHRAPMTTDVALPWTVLARERNSLGIGERVLHGPAFSRVRRGVYVPVGVDPSGPDARTAAVAASLPPHAAVGGWAAARLLEATASDDGLEVFDGSACWDEEPTEHSTVGALVPRLGGSPLERPGRVLVCAARESRLAHRPDVRVFRSPVADDHLIEVGGARITSALRTAFDLARLLPVGRAVVAVDRLVHIGVTTPAELREFAHRHARWRGAARVHQVLRLVDGSAESPQESVLRLLWLSSCLGRPAVNAIVRAPTGEFVGRVDLIDLRAGVVGEYDGAWHSGSERRSHDARRHERLLDLGLDVVRATASDLASDDRARQWLGRLRSAYRRAAHRSGPRGWVVTVR